MVTSSATHMYMYMYVFNQNSIEVTFLSERDSVVLQKDDLQTISNFRIIIYNYMCEQCQVRKQ